MFVVCVTIFVKPECIDRFIQVALDNARNTRTEPGNVRFDVLQGQDDPTRFMLYEAYHSPEGFAAHQQTPHYLQWKQAVGDLLAQPRTGAKHRSLWFGDQISD